MVSSQLPLRKTSDSNNSQNSTFNTALKQTSSIRRDLDSFASLPPESSHIAVQGSSRNSPRSPPFPAGSDIHLIPVFAGFYCSLTFSQAKYQQL